MPFASSAATAAISLTAVVEREGTALTMTYRLEDPAGQVLRPAPLRPGQRRRRDGLWESTCLEAFIAQPGSQGYWEYNLGCNGDWNLYRLQAYRQGLCPELGLAMPQVHLSAEAQGLRARVELDLAPLVDADGPLEMSITAVLQDPAGNCSFWALRHGGPEADFHRRDSLQRLEKGPGPSTAPDGTLV